MDWNVVPELTKIDPS